MSNLVILLLGSSGTGKSTQEDLLAKKRPNTYKTVSHTSRARRPDETEGIQYYYVTRWELLNMNMQGELVEFTSYPPHGSEVCEEVTCSEPKCNLYASHKHEIESKLALGDIVIVAEGHGVEQFKSAFPRESVVVYFKPPTTDELRARMERRGTDPRIIEERLDPSHLSAEAAYGLRLADVIVDSERSILEIHTDIMDALARIKRYRERSVRIPSQLSEDLTCYD